MGPIPLRFRVPFLGLLTLAGLVSLASTAAAQADSTRPRVRASFKLPSLGLVVPEVLRSPWYGHADTARQMAAWDSLLKITLDSARASRTLTLRYLSIYGSSRQDREQPAGPVPSGVLGLSPKYANLSIDGQARLELRTDRTRNERCTPVALLDPSSGCRGGFTPPHLDNEFDIVSGGVIGQRLHINVDYSSTRDFTGKNNIQVYYQGLEDEIIQRIEVGTVTFHPPPSRFITANVPANNFGVNATFQIGPVELQALAAQQKGSSVATRTYTVGNQISQPQDRQVRDLDYESGRFFWVIDPATVPGYPALDILNINPQLLPADQRPAQIQVYRYRPPFRAAGRCRSSAASTPSRSERIPPRARPRNGNC